MAIDLSHETLIPFPEARGLVPGRPHLATLHRWRLRGVRGVQLETCLVGGKRFTSVEAIQRFSDRLSGSKVVIQPSTSSQRARKKKQDSAAKFCEESGI